MFQFIKYKDKREVFGFQILSDLIGRLNAEQKQSEPMCKELT